MATVARGPSNAVTDVPGVLVGHHQRVEAGWATGTTVVLTPEGAVAAVDGRGGAPGTRETDLLAPENLVQRVNAVCLSGGSAYGLAAADGVMRWLADRNLGFPVGAAAHEVVPIVPAAVLFDLPRSAWGNRPDAAFGYGASAAAAAGPPAQGCVGAGTGAKLGSLKGGLGTASAVLRDGPAAGATIGALVAANAAGEAVDLTTGRPWAAGLELDGEFAARWPDRPASPPPDAAPLHTTIGVVAVDMELSKAECRRLAVAAQDGLARAVRPAHTMFDGDTVFALATGGRRPAAAGGARGGRPPQPGVPAISRWQGADFVGWERGRMPPFLESGRSRAAVLNAVCAAAADVFARAVVHGLLAAESLAGVPAYRDLWPEALGRTGG